MSSRAGNEGMVPLYETCLYELRVGRQTIALAIEHARRDLMFLAKLDGDAAACAILRCLIVLGASYRAAQDAGQFAGPTTSAGQGG